MAPKSLCDTWPRIKSFPHLQALFRRRPILRASLDKLLWFAATLSRLLDPIDSSVLYCPPKVDGYSYKFTSELSESPWNTHNISTYTPWEDQEKDQTPKFSASDSSRANPHDAYTSNYIRNFMMDGWYTDYNPRIRIYWSTIDVHEERYPEPNML